MGSASKKVCPTIVVQEVSRFPRVFSLASRKGGAPSMDLMKGAELVENGSNQDGQHETFDSLPNRS